ncbi:hypothetical protein PIB30_006939, partial [Stylosanthes scabra]|nr:hypothetical protein [Stylosanthes scabra]
VVKVKNDGPFVLGCWMARRESRVCIELGVQEVEWMELSCEIVMRRFLSRRNRFEGIQSLNLISIRLGVESTRVSEGTRGLDAQPTATADHREYASSGSVGLGYDNRPGELTVVCRNRHASCAFVLHRLGVPTCFSGTGSSLESWRSIPSDFSSLVSPRVQVFRCGCVEN